MAAWKVREAKPAEYEAIRARMGGIFAEVGGQKVTAFGRALWEWQYLKEDFPAVIVVADDGGELCGYFHLPIFPMHYGERETRAAVTLDLGTLPAYRRQGMMRALDTFGRELLAERGVQVVYGFPHDISFRGFTGKGAYSLVTKMPIYVRPLNFARLLAGPLRLGPLGTALGAIAGPLYRAARVRPIPVTPPAEVVQLDHFDDGVDALSTEFVAAVRIGLRRTARYLNWRFFEKPSREYTAWGLRRDGRLRAYVVTRVAQFFGADSLVLVDLGCARGEEQALLALLGTRLAAGEEDGLGLSLTIGLHPMFTRLSALGFVRVPERLNPRLRYFVAGALSPAVGPELLDPGDWLVTLADWDVM